MPFENRILTETQGIRAAAPRRRARRDPDRGGFKTTKCVAQRETTFSEATAHRFFPPTRAASLLPWCSMDCACNASISSRRDPHCSPFFLGISQQPAATRTVPKSMAGATSRNVRGNEWMLKVSEHAPTDADRCNAPCQA